MTKPVTMYKIVREIYRHASDIGRHPPYRVADHGFDPMTLDEAIIIKPKLSARPNMIDHIVAIDVVHG